MEKNFNALPRSSSGLPNMTPIFGLVREDADGLALAITE